MRRHAIRTEGVNALVPFSEAPTPPVSAYAATRSAAIIVQAPLAALDAAPPPDLDSQVEETMDYTPITDVAAPDFPPEEWPEGAGPLGF